MSDEDKPRRVVKKKVAKKTAPPTKKAVKKTGKKVAVKAAKASKTAKKVSTKKTTKKTSTKAKATREPRSRELNEHGYTVGTDGAIISDILVAGGESRDQITNSLGDYMETTTRTGGNKNLSSLVSSVIKFLTEEQGYTIEQTFALVPPTGKTRKSPAKPKPASHARSKGVKTAKAKKVKTKSKK